MVRRARLVLVAALLAVIAFGVLGVGSFAKLKTGGFQDPGAAVDYRADADRPALRRLCRCRLARACRGRDG